MSISAYRHRPSHRPQMSLAISISGNSSAELRKHLTAVGNILWSVVFIMVFYRVILTLTNTNPNANPNSINEYNIHNKEKWQCATCGMKCRNPFIWFWPSGTKEPGSESSRDRNGQGAKGPGSELAKVLLADSLPTANWPGSEKARY